MKTRREHLSVLPAGIVEEIHEEVKHNLIGWFGKHIDVDKKLEAALSYKVQTFKESLLGGFIVSETKKRDGLLA